MKLKNVSNLAKNQQSNKKLSVFFFESRKIRLIDAGNYYKSISNNFQTFFSNKSERKSNRRYVLKFFFVIYISLENMNKKFHSYVKKCLFAG